MRTNEITDDAKKRLEEWAIAYRGGSVDGYDSGDPGSSESYDPDAAAEVEQQMTLLKAAHQANKYTSMGRYYEILRRQHLFRQHSDDASMAMGLSTPRYRALRQQAYVWMHARLYRVAA